MDWVLAKVKNGELVEYAGIEVQSIDITNNYRDNWYAYKNLNENTSIIPRSKHGLNWANVHKRLIPQLIRKGLIYAKSDLVSHGLYFVLPDIVYRKFEDVIGKDIPLVNRKASDVLTVHTYSLSDNAHASFNIMAVFLLNNFYSDQYNACHHLEMRSGAICVVMK